MINTEKAGSPEDNLLPADETANVLDPEVADAVQTIKDAVRRYEGEGDAGLRRVRLLVGEVDDALFSAATASRAERRKPGDDLPQGLILYGARNLELLARILTEAGALESGLRYLLSEAPEEVVVVHAIAAAELAGQTGNEVLRLGGAEALRVCRVVAERRGFAARIKSLEGGKSLADAE